MFKQTETIARDAFSEIFRQFPHLTVNEDNDRPVEISLTIPEQNGLKHEVWLGLQNEDELHFSVSHFQLGWFPCTESKEVSLFIEAVCGFLSGQNRVLEHYRGSKCIRTELQQPVAAGWKTIGTSSRLYLPFFQRRALKIVVNA